MIIVYPAHLPERAAALVPQALCAKGLAALRHMSTGPVLWHLGLLRGLIGKMTHGIKPAVQGKGRVFMAGTLYLVATPIGNLDDMTPRAAATFASADFVAAEDTRVRAVLGRWHARHFRPRRGDCAGRPRPRHPCGACAGCKRGRYSAYCFGAMHRAVCI